ncbi:MAG: hypothetical protein ACOXZM_05825 [Eubacteriales bacterium]|jgi:hypothetical protein
MNTGRRILLLILVLTLAVSVTCALPGDTDDPVVTLRYLTDIFQPSILLQADNLARTKFGAVLTKLDARLADPLASVGADIFTDAVGEHVTWLNTGTYRLPAGTLVSGSIGTTLLLGSGKARIISPDALARVDGKAVGTDAAVNALYIIAGPGGFRMISDGDVTVSAGAYMIGKAPVSDRGASPAFPTTPAVTEGYEKYARALNAMGLFRGTNKGYELNRTATRTEALVMLIRLLGEENAALASKYTHPFRDVMSWADRYTAYGFRKGYTKGVSETRFGASDAVTCAHYATFLLRALGYDSSKDFSWERAPEYAETLGLMTAAERTALTKNFTRDGMVYLSYRALMTNMKGTQTHLLDRLIADGAVTMDDAYRAAVIVG